MNSNKLRWIAIITMTIDHIGYVLFPDVLMLRVIGRVAMPIFVYLTAYGYLKTNNFNIYLARLGAIGLFSTIPYTLIINPGKPGTFILTLMMGLLALRSVDSHRYSRYLEIIALCLVAEILGDWGAVSVLLMIIFHKTRTYSKISVVALSSVLFITYYVVLRYKMYYVLIFTIPAILAVIMCVYLFNMEKGKEHRFLFQYYYPIHLWVLTYIKFLT